MKVSFLEYFVGLLLFMYKFYNIKCKLVSFTVAGMGCASSPWRSIIIIIISLILGALLCDWPFMAFGLACNPKCFYVGTLTFIGANSSL